jgi:hypothetical protein
MTIPDQVDFLNHYSSIILAQQQNFNDISKIDILADLQLAFTNFLGSGQAGAMMIGLVMGYMIRGITR